MKFVKRISVVLAAVVLVLGCDRERSVIGGSPSLDLPHPEDLHELEPALEQKRARLVAEHLEAGYVGPRRDGAVDLEGDSLAWQGLALGSLDCGRARPLLATLAASVERRGGALLRFDRGDGPVDPELTPPNLNSRDGVSAVAWGLVVLTSSCPELRPAAAELWRQAMRFVDEQGGGALYPGNLGALVTPAMRFVLDATSHFLLGHARPSREALHDFEAGLLVTAADVMGKLPPKFQKKPCYPLHIETLQIDLADRAGRSVSGTALASFCSITDGSDMPATDWLCGRARAKIWLSDSSPRLYMHRHQRCPAWESPDLKSYEVSHELDWTELSTLARRQK